MIDEKEPYLELIRDIRKEEKMDLKISNTLMLLDAIPISWQEKPIIKSTKKYLEKLNNNIALQRAIKFHNKLIDSHEDALLYYGTDYVGDIDYVFDEKLEQLFIQINNRINKALAEILNSIVTEELEIELCLLLLLSLLDRLESLTLLLLLLKE